MEMILLETNTISSKLNNWELNKINKSLREKHKKYGILLINITSLHSGQYKLNLMKWWISLERLKSLPHLMMIH